MIGVVPVDPGLTNAKYADENGEVIGFNTENQEINEGTVNFDIVFYVHRKCGLTKVILNIEPQKDEPSKYPILNRGIFYVSRLISSQKYRDFKGQEYGDICEVYSVWICMNMPENSMCHIHLTQDDLVGEHKWDGDLDLINLVMIGVSNDLAEHDETHELLRFLGTLFSKGLTSEERISIMEGNYSGRPSPTFAFRTLRVLFSPLTRLKMLICGGGALLESQCMEIKVSYVQARRFIDFHTLDPE